jgi:hypothetical protein
MGHATETVDISSDTLETRIQAALEIMAEHQILDSCNVAVPQFGGSTRIYCVMRSGRVRVIA